MKHTEITTDRIFRDFYGSETFKEKSEIDTTYGFTSKKGGDKKGYPDFFKDTKDYSIIVESKSSNHINAESEVQFYMLNNKINKDLVGIAISGLTLETLTVSYFYKDINDSTVRQINKTGLLSIADIDKLHRFEKYGELISKEKLIKILKELNEYFHKKSVVRDTDRSLFFSGILIALNDNTFRQTYKNISEPTQEANKVKLESENMNSAIVKSITTQIQNKINNNSKVFNWAASFGFIENISISLEDYKYIIETIEKNIYHPFKSDEKQDILGRAYKIFLSRAGQIDNKNIILTPDHIKELMVKLARLGLNDVVLDTCTGSGGFLMESMETLVGMANGNTNLINKIKTDQLIGFEVDPVLFSLACSNMFLHGDGRTNLLFASSLLGNINDAPMSPEDAKLFKYVSDLMPTKCIINPPYEDSNPILFTRQALKYLSPHGMLVVIMPCNTLEKHKKKLTKQVLELGKLEAVIKMPKNIFSEQKRTVNTSIFIFTKQKHSENDMVIFYDMTDDGFISKQNKGRQDFNNRWTNIESTLLDSIRNSNIVPNISEKKLIFKNGELNCYGWYNQTSNNPNIQTIKISDIFDTTKGTIPSEEGKAGNYPFITAGEIWKTYDSYSEDCEALVYAISASGSLGRSHYFNGKFVASNLCLILKDKCNIAYPINLEFYNYYLNSIKNKIVKDLAGGASKLVIKKESFEDYYINYYPLQVQEDFVKKHIRPINKTKKTLIAREDRAMIELGKI